MIFSLTKCTLAMGNIFCAITVKSQPSINYSINAINKKFSRKGKIINFQALNSMSTQRDSNFEGGGGEQLHERPSADPAPNPVSPGISTSKSNNLDLTIAIQKGTCSCTLHLISNCLLPLDITLL